MTTEEELIARCIKPLERNEGTHTLQMRIILLLAAILRKLS